MTKENVLKWAEHALVVGAIAGLTDLAAGVSGVSSDQYVVLVVGAAVGAAIRFLNKFGSRA